MIFKKEVVIYTLVSLLSVGFGIVITTAFAKKNYKNVNYENVGNKEIVEKDNHDTSLQKANLENQINDIQEQISALKEMNAKLNSENRAKTNNDEDTGSLLVNVNIINNDDKNSKKDSSSDKKVLNKIQKSGKQKNKIIKRKPVIKKQVKQNLNVTKPTVEAKKVNEREQIDVANETKEIKTIETIVQKVEQPQRIDHVQNNKNITDDNKTAEDENEEDTNVVYNTIVVEDEEYDD